MGGAGGEGKRWSVVAALWEMHVDRLLLIRRLKVLNVGGSAAALRHHGCVRGWVSKLRVKDPQTPAESRYELNRLKNSLEYAECVGGHEKSELFYELVWILPPNARTFHH